jgi:hypothetical protein
VTYGFSVGWTVEHLYDVRVFERLRDAISDIDTDLVELGDVPVLCALQDLLAERVNAAVTRLDTEGAHGIDGAVSMPAWLRHKACQSAASASQVVRTGRKLRYFDAVREASVSGCCRRVMSKSSWPTSKNATSGCSRSINTTW